MKYPQIFRQLLFALIGGLIVPASLGAGDWEIFRKGTSSAAFLLIGTDARSMGLGGETAGMINASSIYWNPANSMGNPHNQLSHEHGKYLLGIQHQVTTLHYRVSETKVLSAQINNLDLGREEITSELEPQGTGQYYSSQSLALSLNFAAALTDKVSVGIQGKLVSEQIWLEKAQNAALDIGLRFDDKPHQFALGMAIQNLGKLSRLQAGPRSTFTQQGDDTNPGGINPDVVYDLKEFPLPLLFRMGLSRRFTFASKGYFTPSLMMNLGFSDGFSTPFRTSFGMELSPLKSLQFRGGYRLNSDLGALSLGMGIVLPLGGNRRLLMDYAWIDMDYFGAVERYQLSLEF